MKKRYDFLQSQSNYNHETSEQDLWKERRFRRGKTARDKESGAKKRNEENKALRAEYTQSRNPNAVFPASTARGNGNSSKRRKYYG
jgi:hypothetical protein